MKFTYDGKSTDDFDVFVASFETVDELTSGLTREVIRSEFNTVNSITNHIGVKYSEPITFTRALVKKDESEFTLDEIRAVAKWLTSPKVPMDMLVTASCNNNGKTYLYKGLFTDIQYKIANGIAGIIFTFTNNSPFLYEVKEEVKTLTGHTTWYYECSSDEAYDYCYPKLEITYKGTSEETKMYFNNVTDKNSFTINLKKDNTVVIDCKNQIIKDNSGAISITDLINENNQIYWLRLVDGTNRFDIASEYSKYPCEIKITNYEIRKAGEIYEY